MILYPINIESAPNYVMNKAFARHFNLLLEYDWVNVAKKSSLRNTQEHFLGILKEMRPEYCFMQLQNEANMSVPMIREMARYTKILNWSGDIRQTKEWYKWFEDIGREIHLTLFSNETDVDIMRSRGVRADYLQVGFDDVWYDKKPVYDTWHGGPYPEIVFCANDYGKFQLSEYRAEVAIALKKHFGERFQMFGSGWKKWGLHTSPVNNELEAKLYSAAKIGISVSNFSFKRYHSDRLTRIMACGTLPMSHDYERLDADYQDDEDIAVFKSIPELIKKCEYFLDPENEWDRERIANNAYLTAHTKCTWNVRCQELIELLKNYEDTDRNHFLFD